MTHLKFLVPWLWTLLLAALLSAAEVSQRAEPTAELRWRRVFAPAERMTDWPTHKKKYLPLEAAEFERLLKLARSAGTDRQESLTAQITTAEYHARLEGEQLLTGQAVLTISHSGQSPTMLSLGSCNVAIRQAEWHFSGENDDPQIKKATLGVGPGGKLQLLVQRNAKLSFFWSLAGRRDSGEASAFFCEFPAAPLNVLWLDLPENLTPAVDKGLVSGVEGVAGARRQWRIELGGNCRYHLRLTSSMAAEAKPPLALLRVANVYEFSPRGVDLSAQWKIQVHHQPLEKIRVLLEPGVQLISVKLGDDSLPWTIEPLADKAGTRAVLILPSAVQDTERIIRLSALAPLPLNQSFRLPRMLPEGLFWQEGTTSLIVLDPLVISQITPLRCVQKAVAPLAEPRMGESLQFQNFIPDAGIELTLANPPAEIQLVSGTAVELGSRQIAARLTADFRAAQFVQSTLEATVTKSWLIDSVESVPPEALADWSLETQAADEQKLLLHLSKTPPAKQSLRLLISARRLRTVVRHQWSVSELLPLRFTNLLEKKRLVAIQAANSSELKLIDGEQLAWLNAERLSPAELSLFADPPTGLLFLDEPGAAAEIALEQKKPSYSGEVFVEVKANQNHLQESYLLRCVPESARSERVVIQLSEVREAPPRWTVAGEDGKSLNARKWSPAEQSAAGLGTAGETWELTLRRPRDIPFEIQGARETPLDDRQTVCLASLPEASAQHGTLSVFRSAAEGLRIDNRRLKSIPPQADAANRYSIIQATFRFDPVNDVTLSNEPALILLAADKEILPPVFVWNCHLDSWCQAQGEARHLVRFELQNIGESQLQFILPPGVAIKDLRGAWVDNVPVAWQEAADSIIGTNADKVRDIISVPLPPGKRLPTVSLYFITHDSGLGTFGALTSPLPTVKAPVLAAAWTVWMPPGFEVVTEDSHWRTSSTQQINCTQRLFGPLGQDAALEFIHPTPPHPAENGKSCWIQGSPPGCQPTDTQGWNTVHLQLSVSQPLTVRYVNRFNRQCWMALIFLLFFATGYWKAVKCPILFVVLTTLAGILAFVLPEAYVPLATAAVLGMFACLVTGIIRFYVKKNAPRKPSEENSSLATPAPDVKTVVVRQAGMAMMIFAASFFFGPQVCADETTAKPQIVGAADYRVFIPIDAQKKSVGDKVYVPEEFYQALYRRADQAWEEPRAWLLGAAWYRGSLVREATGRVTPELIKAQFDLQVFSRMVQVRLPFQRNNVELISETVLLDGRRVQTTWQSDGAALKFEVEEPGNYRLELSLRPKIHVQADSAAFEIAIPRIADSRLELLLPPEPPAVDVPSAIGIVRKETDPPRLLAELGPRDQLAVRWSEGVQTSIFGVDQFLWFKVQSGSVVVDVRCKFHVPEGQPISRIQLAVDSHLRLLPLQGDNTPSVEVRSASSAAQIINLQWDRPLTEDSILDLSFLYTGASGVGKFRLPQIDLLEAAEIKRMLAVSVDPLLEFESRHSLDAETITTAEFLKNWGTAALTPQQAFRLSNNQADWSLSVRPRQAQIAAQPTLALSFDLSKIEISYDAQLTVASGYVFQYQLSVPAEMKVLQVSVQKEGAEQVARWSQGPEGAITVFLKGPAEGVQQLSFRGLLPLRTEEKIALPRVCLGQCRVQATTLQVFRHPAVRLELQNFSPAMKSLPNPSSETDLTGQGRVVGVFRMEGEDQPQGEVLLTANRPQFQAQQVIRLHQQDQQWTARADFAIAVSDGLLDQFWIDLPGCWKEPYSIDPPGILKIVELPGQLRRLLVQPSFAVSDMYHFSIAGALEFKSGETPYAPNIFLRKTDKYSRWLVLPRQINEQAITWEVNGLWPARLPNGLAEAKEEKNNYIYEILSQTPRATLRPQITQSAPAQVRLADLRVAWQANGLLRGTAAFDLAPGGQKNCPLIMPDGVDLVSVTIDGQPVSPLSQGPNQWQLPLISQRLPQRVGVVFQSTLSAPLRGGLRKISAPSLGNLPVTRTLWTILSPAQLVPKTGNDQHSISLFQQQWLRLRNAGEMIISGAELLQMDDTEETRRWYQLQVRYLIAARAALQKELYVAPASEPMEKLKQEIEAVDRQQTECAQRIGMTDVLKQAQSLPPAPNEATDCWQADLDESTNTVRLAINGQSSSITVDYLSIAQMGPCARSFAVLCLAGVAFATILGIRHGFWIAILKQQPYAVGIAAGLAWWCWLRPSFLGLVVAAVCLIAWCRAVRTNVNPN